MYVFLAVICRQSASAVQLLWLGVLFEVGDVWYRFGSWKCHMKWDQYGATLLVGRAIRRSGTRVVQLVGRKCYMKKWVQCSATLVPGSTT